MQNQKTHWPSILILLCIIPGLGIFFLSAVGLSIDSLVVLITHGGDPVGSMIAAAATGFEGSILAIATWIVFQKTRGRPEAELSTWHPITGRQILIALMIIGLSISIGTAVSLTSKPLLSWLFLPAMTIFVIVSPIWILSGWGTTHLNLGPRWRVWSIIGLGMTVGPLIMISIEIIIGLIFVISAAVFLATQPGMANEIQRLAATIDPQTNPEQILEQLMPLIMNPGVVAAILGYIALFVPLVEELFKPFGIWLFIRKIESPAQGFALGVLCGAAYALVESLGVSGQGGTNWAVVVGLRAGTSLLHITTTGLMGWAIISTWTEKRLLRLPVIYMLTVLIHGIWNASAIGVGFAVISNQYVNSDWLITIAFAAVCGMATLGVGLLALLIISNRKMRNIALPVSSTAQAVGESVTARRE
jgi:hypothetical protein